MFAFVLALMMMLVLCTGIIGFIAWAFCQWRTAQKYRYLIRLHKMMPPACVTSQANGPRWKVTYKEKGKSKSEIVEAKNEGEAVRNFVGFVITGCEKL